MDQTGQMSHNSLMMIPDMQGLRPLLDDPTTREGWIVLLVTAAVILYWAIQYRSSRHIIRNHEDYQTALGLLDKMIVRDPTNAMAFWQKGEVYEAMGMHEHALKHYKVAHQMCPRAYAYNEFTEAYERVKENLKVKAVLNTSHARN
jgi:tetratricopeptide (TPR) repeat protein